MALRHTTVRGGGKNGRTESATRRWLAQWRRPKCTHAFIVVCTCCHRQTRQRAVRGDATVRDALAVERHVRHVTRQFDEVVRPSAQLNPCDLRLLQAQDVGTAKLRQHRRQGAREHLRHGAAQATLADVPRHDRDAAWRWRRGCRRHRRADGCQRHGHARELRQIAVTRPLFAEGRDTRPSNVNLLFPTPVQPEDHSSDACIPVTRGASRRCGHAHASPISTC